MKFLKGGEAELLTVLVLTPLSILFAEILPKSLFRAKPELIFKTAKLFQILYVLTYPLTYVFYRFPSKLITLLTHAPSKDKALYTKEQIKVAISKGEERGVLEDYERSILHKVFDVGERQVKEIMIPFKKVIYLDKELTIKEAKEEFKKHKFSRMPIYDQENEKFIGLVGFMDFIIEEVPPHENITKIMHPIIYVDDNTYLDELLIRMLKEKAHLIGIKNSIGMTVGIVTLEDVLEEIVGEY
jgi:putative hemolysin